MFLIAGTASLATAQDWSSKSPAGIFTVQPNSTITVSDDYGVITVRSNPSGLNQVLVSTKPHSDKVEVDHRQTATRVDLRSHYLQKADANEGAVDYDVQVPSSASVVIHTGAGTVTVGNVNGDISVDSDTGAVDVHDAMNDHVHVRTVNGPVTLANIQNGHVEVTTVGGEVTFTNVSGSQVSANTNNAPVHFNGDCQGGGDYTLSTHSGNIDVSLPTNASVDVTARSVTGSVEDGFQLQPDTHPAMALATGKSFTCAASAGKSRSKSSSLGDHATVLTSVPIPSIEIRISSPRCKVNESGGTIPVPVSR